MNPFELEYDLGSLVDITPKDREFRMCVAPRYIDRYTKGSYESMSADLLLNQLKTAAVLVDVGAHYGFYSLLAGTSRKGVTVLAFEPVAENFRILQRNIDLNPVEDVRLFNVAVSDHEGRRAFNITEASDSCGFYPHPLTRTIRQVDAEAVCLDAYRDVIGDRPVIIKVDTEGHELHVLRGAEKLLSGHRDVRLFLECNPKLLKKAGASPEDLLERIGELGFDIHFIDDTRRRIYTWRRDRKTEWETFFRGQSYMNLCCVRKSTSTHVCLFSHSSQLGGAERSILELAAELIQDHGAVCTAVLPGPGPLVPRLNRVGVATVEAHLPWWAHWGEVPGGASSTLAQGLEETLRLIRSDLELVNPDVVVTNTLVIPWGAVAAGTLGRPHLWCVREFGELDHNLRFHPPLQEVLEIIKESSGAIATNSHAVRNFLFPDSRDDKIFTAYCHFDEPAFPVSSDSSLRHFTRCGATKLLILGSITPAKGQEDAVLAVRELTRAGEEVELVVMGTAHPGYLSGLQTLVKTEGLEDRVKFFGFSETPELAMEEADIVLVCSRNEAFGRVTIESMISKKPVVGAGSQGTAELIQADSTGLLYPPGDWRELARKISFLIHNRSQADEYARRGYSFAKATFTREAYGGKIFERIRQLRAAPCAPSAVASFRLGEMAAVTSGYRWRMRAQWHKLRDRLAPSNSRRRRAYERALRALNGGDR